MAAVTPNGNGTRLLHSNLPVGLLKAATYEMFAVVRTTTIGYNGTWAMETTDGQPWNCVNNEAVLNILRDERQVAVSVELMVCLSCLPDKSSVVHGSQCIQGRLHICGVHRWGDSLCSPSVVARRHRPRRQLKSGVNRGNRDLYCETRERI